MWKLCELLHNQKEQGTTHDSQLFTVFISSPEKRTPFWFQKTNPRNVVVWDYHVILIQKFQQQEQQRNESLVFDLDTVLDFPCPFREYIGNSLLTTLALKQRMRDTDENRKNHIMNQYIQMFNRIRFRIVSSKMFYENFSSDRSHMIDKISNEWMSPPPSYPCIKRHAMETMNLPKYMDMSVVHYTEENNLLPGKDGKDIEQEPYGMVFDLKQFCLFFGEDLDQLKNEFC